jgi:hypothetical protein
VISFTPRPLYPGERHSGTHWMGGWMVPRAGLDDVEKRKFLNLPRLEIRSLSQKKIKIIIVFVKRQAVLCENLSPLWREDGSVIYNCCWPSPAQLFSGPSPVRLMTTFYSLRFETPHPGGPGPRIYIPKEQGGPVIPPGTVFHFFASYDSQGYGADTRPRLHTDNIVRVTLSLVYNISARTT